MSPVYTHFPEIRSTYNEYSGCAWKEEKQRENAPLQKGESSRFIILAFNFSCLIRKVPKILCFCDFKNNILTFILKSASEKNLWVELWQHSC